MLLKAEREQVVEFGKQMSSAGLSSGTSGNISAYDDKTGYMVISPSGIGYFDTKIEDVVVMNLEGKIIEGDKKPSSEFALHSNIYKLQPSARGVVHTHSTYCSTLACMNQPVVATHYLLAGAEMAKVPCVPYATYGTTALAEAVKKTMPAKGLALLLANHGLVAWGNSLAKAFNVASNVEWVAEIQWRAMCAGKPIVLPDDEIERVIESFKGYGQASSKKSGY